MHFTLAETIQILYDNKYTIRKVRLIFDADREPPIVIKRELLQEPNPTAKLAEQLPESVGQFWSMSDEQRRQLTDEDRFSRIAQSEKALAEYCAGLNRPEVERANTSLQECRDRQKETPSSREIQRLISYHENVIGYFYQWYADANVPFPTVISEVPPAGEAESPKLTERQQMLERYIGVVKKLRNPAPTFEQLDENSKISGRTWRRRLVDSAFLLELKQELERRRNTARSKETRELWIKAGERIVDLLERKTHKLRHSRERAVGGRIEEYPDSSERGSEDDE